MRTLYVRGSFHRAFIKAPYIIAAIITGLVSVGFGTVVDRVTEFASHMLKTQPLVFLALTPMAFGLSRWFVQKFGVAASGSGIPQVMAALSVDTHTRAQIEPLLNFKILLAKIVSGCLCLLGGGIVGREGPMVQVSAIIFLGVGDVFRKFKARVDYHSLIVAGGAAGVAAAFNTPLGGIVFAIEELLSQHFSKVRSALIVAVIIAGMVAQSFLGPYLYLGAVPLQTPKFSFIVPLLTVSALAGLMGGFFGKALIFTQTSIGDWSARRRLLWAVLCGFIVALFLVFMSDQAPYVTGGGTRLIRDILWQGKTVDFLLVLERFVVSLVTFISGCAGGIFAPSLAFGAALGKCLVYVFSGTDPVALTLIGMVSFLASVTRAPFTSMVLVTEMSDGHGLSLHVLLASLFAVGVARSVESRSYYHFQAEFYRRWITPQEPESDAESDQTR
ncbi:MAG TPA: chloride channel protein [Oligoflexus sp.]|uniref:chloride channel protein n=1 Tax=Oligoflexus sp. TaxID=1971216 RepID=UPI002D7E887A|nr:chloride channel protein [Oligoflexus sp.]HET9240126.1 chloride channel protein [Oligoflexus sp.]